VLDSALVRKVRAVANARYNDRKLGGELFLTIRLDGVTADAAERAANELLEELARGRGKAEDVAWAKEMLDRLDQSGVVVRETGSPRPPITVESLRGPAQALRAGPRVVITTLPQPAAPRSGRLLVPVALVDAAQPDGLVVIPAQAPDADFRHRVPAPRATGRPAVLPRALALPGGSTVRYIPSPFPDDFEIELMLRGPPGEWNAADRACARVLTQLLWEASLTRPLGGLEHKQVFLEPLQRPGTIGARLFGSSKFLRRALPLFARRATDWPQDAASVDRAQSTVARDLRRQWQSPQGIWSSLLEAGARGEPLDLRGELTAVEAVRLVDLRALHQRLFQPGNALLVATASGLPAPRLQAQLARVFTGWPAARPSVAASKAPPPPRGRLVVVDQPGSSRAHVVVAFPFPPRLGASGPAAALLAEALAGGLDSRMGRLRTRSGWFYGFRHWMTVAPGGTQLVVQAEVPPARANELVTALFREAADLAATPLPKDELEALRSGRARAWETSLSWGPLARDLAGEAWLSAMDLTGVAKQPARLRAVAADDIRNAASTYLVPARAQVFVLGPRAQLSLSHPALAPPEVLSWSP
jgi:predicted Zn-dependent peptidase